MIGRLNICSTFGDTWAWVAPGPERQQAAAAGAHEADEAGPVVDKGSQDIPAHVHAPQPPSPAPQRIERIKEEMHELRRSVVGLRGVVESFTTEQSRVSTWMISYALPEACQTQDRRCQHLCSPPHTYDQPDP
ncbi:hypothetical protein Tco_1396642 [Tanacetum coccineum]